MAKIKEIEEINPIPIKKYKKIVLELDEIEATVLSLILERIGGSSYQSPRKYAKQILDALHSLDLDLHGNFEIDNKRAYKNYIYFKDGI